MGWEVERKKLLDEEGDDVSNEYLQLWTADHIIYVADGFLTALGVALKNVDVSQHGSGTQRFRQLSKVKADQKRHCDVFCNASSEWNVRTRSFPDFHSPDEQLYCR